MWYFTWILGIGFAVLLAIVNAIWLENEAGRKASYGDKDEASSDDATS